jgi:hypothetical protein
MKTRSRLSKSVSARRLVAIGVGVTALMAFGPWGCIIVDDSLYKDLERAEAEGGAAGVGQGGNVNGTGGDDGAGGDGPPPIELSEECEPGTDYFPLDGAGERIVIDTRELRDNVNQQRGLSCTGKPAPGADGFFAIEVEFGDTWHFHLSPDQEFFDDTGIARNPVLYVLDETCDIRNCPRGHDICERNSDEHFTYTSTDRNPTTVHVGIDDRFEGGGVYTLQAIKVDCELDEVQHGKACVLGSDDCDDRCRSLLDPRNPIETTVSHAEFTSANVIRFPDGESSVSIQGGIGGCEPDFYALEVSDGARIEAALLTDDEEPCPEDAEPVLLELFDSGLRLLEDAEPSSAEACPSLVSDELDEGEYFLKLSKVEVPEDGSVQSSDYSFLVEVVEP